MKNLFDMIGLSYRAPVKGDSRRASYTAVPVDRAGGRGGGPRRRSYGNNRRQSLDPAAVLGRHLFDGRLADPRTRNACESAPTVFRILQHHARGRPAVQRFGRSSVSRPVQARSGAEKVGKHCAGPSVA